MSTFLFHQYCRHLRPFLCLASLGLLSACATVVAGTTQDIAIDTEPAGATCNMRREGQQIMTVAATPAKVNVPRRVAAIELTCTRDGFEPATAILASKFNGATVGNVILGGIVGVVIDGASGANNTYPERTILVMTPASFENETARDAYFEALAARVREKADTDIKTIRDRCRASQGEFCRLDVARAEEARDKTLAEIDRRRQNGRPATPPAISSRR